MTAETDLPVAVRESWQRFLGTFEPLRPELYRYCRHLTRSPWDAEDLAQDAMARAFVTLGQMGADPPNPRAWLFRVASNLWIDQQRRRKPTDDRAAEASAAAPDPIAAREAAGTLLGQLAPQERAAVVLKDVFDFSLEEISESLATTPNAVKAALHRARGKLAEPAPEPEALRVPAPEAIEAFCDAFNAGDIARLTAVLLDTAAVEVVGATTLYGRAAAQRVLNGMLFGVKRMVAGTLDARFRHGVKLVPPRVEARLHRGEWLLLHWYSHEEGPGNGDAVRAVTRLALDGDGVARLRNYFFNPDFVADVCGELDVPFYPNGYRWWL